MSVERFQHTLNGAEVEQADINLMSDAGGLADDHVLAELLRLAPFSSNSVAKAILPFGSAATVVPAGATGSVNVNPFRAIVGTRDTAANIGPARNWNDLRSAIFTGPNALAAQQPFQANTTAQARWDLVYAQLQVDAPGQQVSRYRKDPSTEQVAVVQVAKSLVQSIAIAVLAGQPGGAKPSLPPDGGGTFFFPLANVRIPANFGPMSTVAPTDIEELAPYAPLAPTTGASILVPANHQYKEGGSVLSSAAFAWGSGGPRPGPVMPPTMSGCEGRLIAIDAQAAASANWSHSLGASSTTHAIGATASSDGTRSSIRARRRFFRGTGAARLRRARSEPLAPPRRADGRPLGSASRSRPTVRPCAFRRCLSARRWPRRSLPRTRTWRRRPTSRSRLIRAREP
jgi:hypothetical protein